MLDGLAQPIPQISIHGRIISSSQRSWIGIKHSIISLISLGAHHLYSSSESKSEIPCIFASQSAKSAALLIDLVFKFSVFLYSYFSPLSFFSRHSDQSFTHHGQASLGLVRVVQSSHLARRPSGSHQQEAVARNHQGSQPTLIYHLSSIHPKNTVSTRNYHQVNISVEIYFFLGENSTIFDTEYWIWDELEFIMNPWETFSSVYFFALIFKSSIISSLKNEISALSLQDIVVKLIWRHMFIYFDDFFTKKPLLQSGM